MTNQDLIQQIQERVDIVQLIGRYTSLKKKGQRYIGLCPFHKEKTPSFCVNVEKKLFYCFGCQEGGNIYHFVMKYRKCTFYEALTNLGATVGIDVKNNKNRNSMLDGIRYVLAKSCQFYYDQLHHSQAASAMFYLTNRHIKSDLVDQFKLGYAPNSGRGLCEYLNSHVNLKTQLASNVVRQTMYQDKIVDYFRDRLIFPIFDEWNKIVAFGGRALTDSSYPKYLNLPDSFFFKKSSILYGLNFARSVLNEETPLVIVEGYFDVIMAHQYGIKNVVAPLGTGLTEKHLQNISRYTKSLVLMFDGDHAGYKALIRSLPKVLKQGINTSVVGLDNGMDPYDYLMKFGGNQFQERITNAKDAMDYYVDSQWNILKPKNSQQKRQYLNLMYQMIQHITSEVQKEEVFYKVAGILGVSFTAVKKDYDKYVHVVPKEVTINKSVSKSDLSSRSTSERYLLFIVLNHLEMYVQFRNRLQTLEWKDALAKKMLSTIESFFTQEQNNKPNSKEPVDIPENIDKTLKARFLQFLFNQLETNSFSSDERNSIKKELTEEAKYDENPMQQIEDCLNWLRMDTIKTKLEQLNQRIKHLNHDDDLSSLLEEKQFLMNEYHKFSS